MRRITKITLSVLGLVLLAGLVGVVPGFRPLIKLNAAAQAATGNVLTVDLAVDCRTFVSGPNRGDVFIINGKLFPGGTLPSGTASFDPTQPVNHIAPFGDWLVRGQHALPLPPTIAPSYSSALDFATIYFMLNDGRTLILEGYNFADPAMQGAFTVIGGIGGFSGAAGESQSTFLGTNATGCPNFRSDIILKKEPANYPGWPQ